MPKRRDDTTLEDRAIMPRTEAEHYGAQLAVQIEYGHWSAAHELLDRLALQKSRRPPRRDWLRLSVAELLEGRLESPVRTINLLEGAGYLTVEDLLGARREDLLLLPNMGEKTIERVWSLLDEVRRHRFEDF